MYYGIEIILVHRQQSLVQLILQKRLFIFIAAKQVTHFNRLTVSLKYLLSYIWLFSQVILIIKRELNKNTPKNVNQI